MSYLGFGKSKLPFDMFNLKRSAKEARRMEKLANIYHRGQELAWDGRKVLAEALEKHGGIKLPDTQRQAVSRLFGILMWGELAAWKISAELTDGLVPLEAKMAASSQVHDEARHFYVFHDYLLELGQVPEGLDRATRVILDLVLENDDLRSKLMGMQLLIETLALTLFQAVRETNVDPVLSELLRYFEKDEARHVGLGLQYLPSMLKSMPKREAVKLMLSQAHIMCWAMAELKVIEPDLVALGIEPRWIYEHGMAKQALAFQTLWKEMGGRPSEEHVVDRLMVATAEMLFPDKHLRQQGMISRLVAAGKAFRKGPEFPETSLDPDAEKIRPNPAWT